MQKYILFLLMFSLSCKEDNGLDFTQLGEIESKVDTLERGGVFFDFNLRNEVEQQILINPRGDTVHVVKYRDGKILNSEGRYFYTEIESLTEIGDSVTTIKLTNYFVIPDTSMVINFAVREWRGDSIRYKLKNQYFVDYKESRKTEFSIIETFDSKRPVFFLSITYANKKGEILIFHYNDPIKLFFDDDGLLILDPPLKYAQQIPPAAARLYRVAI